jgi:hypothetical protein
MVHRDDVAPHDVLLRAVRQALAARHHRAIVSQRSEL